MDLFSTIKGFVPEDQQANIKAKVDGEVESLIKDKEMSVKKELSKKYGVNFFEQDVEKAYENDGFVKKSLFEEKENILKTLTEEKSNLEKQLGELKQQNQYGDISVKLLSQGFNPERLEAIKPLVAGDGEIDEKIEKIKTSLPELFLTNKKWVDPNSKDKTKTELTEAELYIQKQRERLK